MLADRPASGEHQPGHLLQVRQHMHAAVDVLRGYGDDFLADAMKFQHP
jgi:hypothetical protein